MLVIQVMGSPQRCNKRTVDDKFYLAFQFNVPCFCEHQLCVLLDMFFMCRCSFSLARACGTWSNRLVWLTLKLFEFVPAYLFGERGIKITGLCDTYGHWLSVINVISPCAIIFMKNWEGNYNGVSMFSVCREQSLLVRVTKRESNCISAG